MTLVRDSAMEQIEILHAEKGELESEITSYIDDLAAMSLRAKAAETRLRDLLTRYPDLV